MKTTPQKRPNAAARELGRPQFRQRIVKSKKLYKRKPRTASGAYDILG